MTGERECWQENDIKCTSGVFQLSVKVKRTETPNKLHFQYCNVTTISLTVYMRMLFAFCVDKMNVRLPSLYRI